MKHLFDNKSAYKIKGVGSIFIPIIAFISSFIILIIYLVTSKKIFHALFSFLFLISVMFFITEMFMINDIKNNLNNIHSNKLNITSEIIYKELSFQSILCEDKNSISYILEDNSNLKIDKNILLKKVDTENKIIIKNIRYQYNCEDFLKKDAYKFMDKKIFYKKIYEIHYKK